MSAGNSIHLLPCIVSTFRTLATTWEQKKINSVDCKSLGRNTPGPAQMDPLVAETFFPPPSSSVPKKEGRPPRPRQLHDGFWNGGEAKTGYRCWFSTGLMKGSRGEVVGFDNGSVGRETDSCGRDEQGGGLKTSVRWAGTSSPRARIKSGREQEHRSGICRTHGFLLLTTTTASTCRRRRPSAATCKPRRTRTLEW